MNARDPVLITVEHAALCLSCEETVHFGEPAYWVREVGIWHEQCPQPLNLAAYIKERDAADLIRGARPTS